MESNFAEELMALRRMTSVELRMKYREVFGEESRSRNRDWLVKRIIWRLQALAEGDLSERAKRRVLELANDADLRVSAPQPRKPKPVAVQRTVVAGVKPGDDRLPMAGTVITRPYKGKTLHVHVRREGFEYDGLTYKTLSAVAKAITGSHTNGFLFFRLGKYGGDR